MIDLRLGDCLEVMRTLADNTVDSVVTDPPYGIRFMGMAWDGQDIERRAAERRSAASSDPQATDRGGHKSIAAEAGKYDRAPSAMLAFQEFSEAWAREALRVLKPGGHLLSFASTRTYHRMAAGIEDAGFELRDQIGWVFGSGFPKSHNGPWGGTALKPAWEPICVARKPLIGTVEQNWREHGTGALNIDGCRVDALGDDCVRKPSLVADTAAGFGKGLAMGGRGSDSGRWPANLIHDGSDEVLAAFPQSAGQLAAVRPDSGTGNKTNGILGKFATNSDHTPRGDTGSAARLFKSFPQEQSCEQPSDAPTAQPSSSLRSALAASVQSAAAIWPSLAGIVSSDWTAPSTVVTESESRTLCEAAITAMASIGSGFSREQRLEKRTPCGSLVSVAATRAPTGTTTITASLSKSDGSVEVAMCSITPTPLDLGEADCARFRYCAKASREDRNDGLHGMPKRIVSVWGGDEDDLSEGKKATKPTANHHPTVKPTDLMRYLCRLVTPAGGLVLDPFMGSGSTGRGAVLEGFRFIGIEREAEYIEIAQARIDSARRQGHQPDLLEHAA